LIWAPISEAHVNGILRQQDYFRDLGGSVRSVRRGWLADRIALQGKILLTAEPAANRSYTVIPHSSAITNWAVKRYIEKRRRFRGAEGA
jgi:hypothetical protein